MKRILTNNLLLFFLVVFALNSAQAQRKKKDKDSPKVESKHFLDTLGLSALKFRSVGPALTSGRIADFAVHPDNPAHYYVATASGGVWKTTNAGTTYEPIFDSQGSYSIGCVTMDPNNPNVVWVGTGENNNQRSVNYGDGVYKSEDGGASWKNMGLENSEHIANVIVHPENSDVVYVSAIGPLWSKGGDRGVYKTTDGGETWKAVLEIDEHTGVTDLLMDPRDPDVLYAAAFQRRRHVYTYVGGGPGSGMYKTTDGGENWKKINKGLPSSEMGRIGLAQSPSDPEVIYAQVEAAEGSGVYKTTNRGASWKKGASYVTSGNYYSEMIPHPTNPDIVFAMDTWLHRSTDGGKSFHKVNEQYKHVDNHAMWINPNNTDHWLVGCDGGIYETFDAAKNWNFKSNLPVTQFYKVTVDNDEPFYNIYGGTQDNFSLGGPSQTRSGHGIVNSDWFITNGGDGFESQVDPNNPNIIYAQSQYGGLVRYDKASGEILGIQPKPRQDEMAYRWNWDAPLEVSKHLDTRIYFAANKLFKSDDRGSTWQVISDDLTRQIDRNTLKVYGKVLSMDAVNKNRSTSPYGAIVAFSESPFDENLLYVGTDDGLIQITTDGGQNWTKVSSFPGVPNRTYVNMVLASQHDENVVYAVFNNHKNGDFKPYVFRSNDKGRTWSSITSNIPKKGSTYCIAEDHVDKDLLFVGTEYTAHVTTDGGKHWKKLSAGLPTITVRDMTIQKRENDLVLATFGRGFYVMDDYSALRNVKPNLMNEDAAIFPIADGKIYIESLPLGLRENSFQGHNYYAAKNPPVGVAIDYFVKNKLKTKKDMRKAAEKKAIEAKKDVAYPTLEELDAESKEAKPYLLFTIKNSAGDIVRKIKKPATTGVNRIVWDGRAPSKSPISLKPRDTSNPFAGVDQGPLVAPGDYTVSLAQSYQGNMTELVAATPFKLEVLGGTTLPAKDRAELVAFQNKVSELGRVFAGTNREISELSKTLKHARKAVYAIDAPTQDLIQDIDKMEDAINEMRKALYGNRNASKLDKDQPYAIANRMGYLGYEMESSTSTPTTTQREAYRIISEELAPLVNQLNGLIDKDLKALEEKLEAAGAPYTPGRRVELGNE